MTTLFLLAFIGVGVLALKKRAGVAAGTLPPPSLPSTTEKPVVSANTINTNKAVETTLKGVKGIADGAASGGATGAAIAAVGFAGAALGEGYSALVGGGAQGQVSRILPFTSLQFQVGAVAGITAGREVDRLLGGTGTGIRGYTAMALGGVVGAVLTCCGTAVAYVLACYAAVIYAIVVWVDQEVRRVWTLNGGPQKEYSEKYWEFHGQFKRALLANDSDASEANIERLVRCVADGFMLQTNRLNYLQAMQLAYGVGATRESHARFQMGYGRFIGRVLPGGDLDDSILPRHGRDNIHMLQRVPPEKRVPLQGRLPWVEAYINGSAEEKKRIETFFGGPNSTAVAMGENPKFCEQFEDVYNNVGRMLANTAAYATWMQESWGIGQSETSHGAWGRNLGKFEGYFQNGDFRFEAAKGSARTVVEGNAGVLFYGGKRCYWRDVAKDVGPFIEVGTNVEAAPLATGTNVDGSFGGRR